MIHIILVEPEIPQNTGNIVRTCAAIGATLHLIRPLGFFVDDRYLKRAGLDYWDEININFYDSFEELKVKYTQYAFFFATTKAERAYSEVKFPEDCMIAFGKESAGLPEEMLRYNREGCIRIPMKEGIRSMNLANSVAVIAYEAARQHGFKDLMLEGKLTKTNWE